MTAYPSRIVCLTEETTETLYLLGEGDRVVGISGYTVRPPEARSKPKVSAFINARFDKIEVLKPDLVLAFSDLQADLTAELIRRGIAVLTFNLVNYGKPAGSASEAVLARWNASEIYRELDRTWRIIHTHWSFTQPRLTGP